MDEKVIAASKKAFPPDQPGITLGAIQHDGTVNPEPTARIPLAMMNRHGLIAGATGTGKTKSLQLMAEQLSRAGVPCFLADVKGDVSGIGAPGEASPKVTQRVSETGSQWTPTSFPIELLSLTGALGAQLRATVSSFGPLLLAKVLGLNETQSSVLAMVFKFADDRGLLLLDFSDLRAVLQHLSGEGAGELANYGGMSKQTVGVLLREMVELEQQGAGAFFGEPEFDLDDLMQVSQDGRGVISVLELRDVQEKPALWSTFMMWMLARLYATLPEAGDLDKPKLVFFFDEAHLLFADSSKAFREQVEQVVRLVRSKGVGVFFVTQSPKDVPADILAQLGNRVQHALRAFTPDDETALRAAARTFPKTTFYDIEESLTTLGIGEALVTVLNENGAPTPPFAVRMIPPQSRMGPLTDAELQQRMASSQQVKEYAEPLDRESAREMLAARVAPATAAVQAESAKAAASRAPTQEKGILDSAIAKMAISTVTRTAMGMITRELMGTLLGRSPRRRRR